MVATLAFASVGLASGNAEVVKQGLARAGFRPGMSQVQVKGRHMDYEDARDTGREAETSQLVSEIAAAAVAAAKAGGVPLLPDAQNVVILPAGATLDDIRVSGRDLVIQLADGRVFVIADGAVFVPQIVIDGVTVPPLNLAALLIGQQPQPAAGAVQSSGGNFAEPTGPIQDAFDLGNLLPYTELAFPEQPDREVLEAPGNNTPTIVIVTPDNPIGAVAATASVNEKGLPPHGALPAGSGEIADGNATNDSDTTETTTGTIEITSLDGIASLAVSSITLNGVAVTQIGQTFAGASGILTVTSIDLANGRVGYSYTLTNSTLGDATSDNFAVSVTDNDGDTASATLAIRIIDDVPTARNDTDALAAGTFGPETGNVISGEGTTSAPGGADTPGADGATLTRIASNNVPANIDTTFDGAGNLVVDGQYGVLSIKADGSYSYTRNAKTPGGVDEVFTYTLTDGDTDTSTATLTISIGDAPPAITDLTPKANGGDALVDEDDLSDGSDTAKESLTTTGTFTIASPDGIASLVVDGRTVVTNGTFTATSWTTPLGNTMSITGYNPATGVVTYTYTLTDNENHPSASGENSLFEDFAITLTDLDGDPANGVLSVNIVDDVPTARSDTDTVPTSGTTATGNVISGADTTSGAAGADTLGADGATVSGFRAGTSGNFAATGATVTGQFGTLTLNANGSYTYTRNSGAGNGTSDVFSYQITDGDGDTSIATLTITIPDRPATVTSVPTTGGGTVVNESGLPPISPNPAGTGEIADGNPDNESNQSEITTGTITFSTPDGFGSLIINNTIVDVNNPIGQIIPTTTGVFKITGFNPTAGTLTYSFTLDENTIGGAANGGNTSVTLTVTVTDIDGDSDTEPFVITIIDDAPIAVNDTDTIPSGSNGPATGNVITDTDPGDAGDGDTGADTPGADGARITFIDHSNAAPGASVPNGGFTDISGQYGTLRIYSNGDYSYTRNAGQGGGQNEVFTYTLTDGDTDAKTATLTILIADSAPVALDVNAFVDDDGLGGNPAGEPANGDDNQNAGESGAGIGNEAIWTGKLGVSPGTGTDTPLSYKLVQPANGLVGTENVTYTLNAAGTLLTATVAAGEARAGLTLFTVSITDPANGDYTVTLVNPVRHADTNDTENNLTVSVDYTVADNDVPADTDTGRITIDFDDDVPTATAEASQNVAEGATVSGTFDFVPGADGAGVTHIGGTALVFDPADSNFSQAVTLGSLGTIKVKANGDFEFTAANPVNNPQTATGTFTVTDGDGDIAQAGFSFVITDANAPRGGQTAASVDDDGLSGATGTGNPASTADDLTVPNGDGDGNEATFGGTLAFTPSADIPNVLSFAGMNGLTGSVGTETVTYSWNGASNTLTATGPRGALFTVQITDVNTGTYKVMLLDNVLHAVGPNQENAVDPTTQLTYTIADSDSPAVTGTLTITFDDDAPSATALAGGDVVEGATVTGTLAFVQGADGASVTHINGTALVFNPADANYSQAIDIGPGSIKVKADGSYSFTAETGLVNPAATLPTTFTVTDGDGDTVQASIAFSVTDAGSPSAPARTATVDDDGLGGGNAASTTGDLDANAGDAGPNTTENIFSGNLGFSYGPDGPAAAALDFLFTSTTGTVGQETVTYSWNDATSTLTATITASPDAARLTLTLFTVVVDQTSGTPTSGNYTLTLARNVLHAQGPNNENDASTVLNYRVQDSDGTQASNTLTITFDDDAPTAALSTQPEPVLVVDDSAMATNASASFASAFAATFGADGGAVSGYALGVSSANANSGIFDVATGTQVVLNLVAGQVVGTAGIGGAVVFTVSVAANGTVTLDQQRAVQHNDPADPDEANGSAATLTADNLVTLTATVTDKDGDTATAVANIGQNLQFKDDGPSLAASASQPTLVVDDTTLAVNVTASFAGVFTPTYGADGAGAVGGYVLGVSAANANSGIFDVATGTQVVLNLVAGQVVGTAGIGGPVVFTVGVASNGDVTLDQQRAVQHNDPADPDEPGASAATLSADNLITLTATVTDKDGDTATAVANIGQNLQFKDDGPGAETNSQSGTVDEDGLPGGTVGGPGDVAGISTTASGSVSGLFQSGADQPLTYQLLNNTGGLPSLTSGGVAVTYAVAGNVLTASAGAGNAVFTLTLNGATGAWDFALLKPLDHPATGIGTDAPGQENDIVINFGALLQATDRDGDKSAPGGPLTITIDDDTPTVTIAPGTAAALLDETAGTGGAAVIATTTTKGDDPDVLGTGAIAKATTASAIVVAGGAYGADGAGTLTYALTITNAVSGLLVSDGTLAGSAITLVNEGGVIVGRVTAGSFANQAAFAISINSTTGVVSVEQYLSLRHPVTTNPDDQVALAAGSLGATVTRTDNDGDAVPSTVADVSSLFRFDDDGPAITSVTTPLAIANSDTVSATGAFVIATGADGQGVGNDTIKTVTFNATVNGAAVSSPTIGQLSEDANTAVFSISFIYNNSPTTTVTETGTLTFNKLAGTYTVDLADPIQGFSISQTATGSLFQGYQLGSSTTDNTSPAVAVTQVTPNLFIQYTGFEGSSTTANYNLVAPPTGDGVGGTFASGELFTAGASWVSVSNSSNGVHGDTIGGDQILDFNLYNSNPTGFVGTPTASADAMFMKFDGIGNNEDFIVVLKLFNGTSYTTKSLLVQNADIQKGSGIGPGVYSGITLDNNDGLIIIEANDYNSGAETWRIVGAQVIVDPLAITGTAINFNNTTGAGGGSSGTQAFSNDTNNGAPMKISSIGFVTNTTTAQTAQLTFVVTVQDGDGDTVQQTLVANVSPVVLDLDGDGAEFLSRSAGVAFDYLGDGNPLSTAWAGKDDGILAIDLDGNGKVDSGKEIVFGGNGLTDLQGIAARYDSNHDGVLDAKDSDFAKFGVWQDANSNGVSDAGEFMSLTDMGIASIDLTSDGKTYSTADGDVTVHGETNFTMTDGTTGTAADASFAVSGADGDLMSALLNLGAGSFDAGAAKTIGDLPPVLAALGESNDSNFVDNLVESLSGGTSGSNAGGDASDDALASLLAAHVGPDHAAGATPFDLSQFTAHDEAMAAAAV